MKVEKRSNLSLNDALEIEKFVSLRKEQLKKKSSGFPNTWPMERSCDFLWVRKQSMQSSSMVKNHQQSNTKKTSVRSKRPMARTELGMLTKLV